MSKILLGSRFAACVSRARRARRACRLAALVVAMFIGAPALAAEQRPNIVLILADDVGFSDLGAYGSEIATPHIDALAATGTLFTNFHASPMCAPSRAMLLTGMESHLAGVGNLPESTPLAHRGRPGYLGRLGDDVVTVATVLKEAGYRTYMTGKWHLGHGAGALPDARGFDRSFALDASGADNWEKKSYLPIYDDADWFEDGEPADLPDDFYSSRFLVDKLIDYIVDDGDAAEPFFAYLAFQAIHIPLQAPAELVRKYEGVYEAGWEALRAARVRGLVERGLIAPVTVPGEAPAGLRDWSSLNARERRLHAQSMAVNAAMLESMDQHIGRLIAHLGVTGELANTVFIVLSDNGPEPAAPTDMPGFGLWLRWVGYNRDVETLGGKGSYAFIGPEFARAGAAPGAFFKFHAGEGGQRVPLIVSGAGLPASGMTHSFAFITDIAPTILALTGAAPIEQLAGRPVKPMTGRSLLRVLESPGQRVYGDDDAVAIEAAGNAAVYKGRYKLVRNMPPLGDGAWQLHDLDSDPGENLDLAQALPEKLAELQADYRAYAQRTGVLEVPDGYRQMRQIAINRVYDTLGRQGIVMVLIAGALLLCALFALVGLRLSRSWR
jgi:arylsulfatase/uncharacterized sulfatase